MERDFVLRLVYSDIFVPIIPCLGGRRITNELNASLSYMVKPCLGWGKGSSHPLKQNKEDDGQAGLCAIKPSNICGYLQLPWLL